MQRGLSGGPAVAGSADQGRRDHTVQATLGGGSGGDARPIQELEKPEGARGL